MLTLVSHHLCPYVQRAAIALFEKSVPFERAMIDLSNPPDWFGEISPLGKVPLLRVPCADGTETVLFESTVICEYIEETQAGARLHPEDPLERAKHRAWMEFWSTVLSDVWRLETATDAAPYEAARAAVASKFAWLEKILVMARILTDTDSAWSTPSLRPCSAISTSSMELQGLPCLRRRPRSGHGERRWPDARAYAMPWRLTMATVCERSCPSVTPTS